jgi:hypothetical protein
MHPTVPEPFKPMLFVEGQQVPFPVRRWARGRFLRGLLHVIGNKDNHNGKIVSEN